MLEPVRPEGGTGSGCSAWRRWALSERAEPREVGETDALVEVVADSMTRLQAVRSQIATLEDVEALETSVILKRHFNRR